MSPEQYDAPIGPEREPEPDANLRQAICDLVEQGVVPKQAAVALGVIEDELAEWLRQETRECLLLKWELQQAEAKAEVNVVKTIKIAAEDDWKAAAWLAERNWPERYQRRSIQGKDAPRTTQENVQQNPFSDLDNVVGIRSSGGSH